MFSFGVSCVIEIMARSCLCILKDACHYVILHLLEFLYVRDTGRRGNKITGVYEV